MKFLIFYVYKGASIEKCPNCLDHPLKPEIEFNSQTERYSAMKKISEFKRKHSKEVEQIGTQTTL